MVSWLASVTLQWGVTFAGIEVGLCGPHYQGSGAQLYKRSHASQIYANRNQTQGLYSQCFPSDCLQMCMFLKMPTE